MAGLKSAFTRRQTALNTVTTGLSFGLNILVGIWFTPFLVGHVGPESYGLVMLAATVVSYGGPLVQTVSTTLVREFAFAKESGEEQALPRLLDSALSLCVRIALSLAAVVALLTIAGPWLLGIHPQFRIEAGGILLLTGLSFLLFVFSAPFAAILYTANRTDVANHSQIAQTVVRVFGAAGLLAFVTRSPLMVPLAGLVGGIGSTIVFMRASYAVTEWRMSWRAAFRVPALRLGGTGAAVLASTIATMLLTATELLVVNYMADEARTGMYAAAIQLAILLRSAMLSLSIVFGPRILASYASGDHARAGRETADAMTLMGIAAALPAGIILVAAERVLSIWLGPAFAVMADVLRIEVIGTLLLVAALPLATFCLAADRVLVPAIARICSVVGYVVLAAVLFRTTTLGLASVALALAIAAFVSEWVFTAGYAARSNGLSPGQFFAPLWKIAVAMAAAAGLTKLIFQCWIPSSIAGLCILGIAVACGHVIVVAMIEGKRVIEAVALVRRRFRPA